MISPLSWEESNEAEAIVTGILNRLAPDAAQRFGLAYKICIDGLCQAIPKEIERRFPPTPDENASLALSRPTYRARFETTKKRARRSSTGVWYLFFWLIDGDGDHVPETLRVVTVRHGSAPLMWTEDR